MKTPFLAGQLLSRPATLLGNFSVHLKSVTKPHISTGCHRRKVGHEKMMARKKFQNTETLP